MSTLETRTGDTRTGDTRAGSTRSLSTPPPNARAMAVVALLLGPIAALGAQAGDYALVERARAADSKAWLVVVTLAGALLAGGGALLARQAMRARGTRGDRLLAVVALLLDLLLLLVVLVGFGLPNLMLHLTD
jgi:hypothetical protein